MIVIVQIPLKLVIGKLICRLILLIILAMLLNSIVGEVDVLVIEVLEFEGFAACANIALFVPIAFEDAVSAG